MLSPSRREHVLEVDHMLTRYRVKACHPYFVSHRPLRAWCENGHAATAVLVHRCKCRRRFVKTCRAINEQCRIELPGLNQLEQFRIRVGLQAVAAFDLEFP